ncbi:MAG: hypothetical protein PHS10_03715 [Thiovulaceae bacterium]|nr:hypothetical protein [Sulfurimonadaceae bacterium]
MVEKEFFDASCLALSCNSTATLACLENSSNVTASVSEIWKICSGFASLLFMI